MPQQKKNSRMQIQPIKHSQMNQSASNMICLDLHLEELDEAPMVDEIHFQELVEQDDFLDLKIFFLGFEVEEEAHKTLSLIFEIYFDEWDRREEREAHHSMIHVRKLQKNQ